MKDQTHAPPRFIPNDLIGQIENTQRIHKQGEIKHDELVITSMIFAYNFVKELQQSESELRRFLTHGFWNGKDHGKSIKKLPRLVMRFIVGAETTDGRLYEKARPYTKIIEYYLDLNISPANMQANLRKTSLEVIYKKIKLNKQGAGATNGPAPPMPRNRLPSTDEDQSITEQFENTSNADDPLDGTVALDSDTDDFPNNENLDNPYDTPNTHLEFTIRLINDQMAQIDELFAGGDVCINIRRDNSSEEYEIYWAVGVPTPSGVKIKRGR